MRWKWWRGGVVILAVMVTAFGPSNLWAQDTEEGAEDGGQEEFSPDLVIHPVIRAMPEPDFRDEIVSLTMAISSPSEKARQHVLQGLAYVQAAWDLEAYRHFCEAVEADPNCLMAYWGIALALAAPNNEFVRERKIAIDRMLQLVGATVEVGGREQPVASVMEQKYALALAKLFSLQQDGPEAFQKLSDEYPNNLQAKCLAIYLQRDGFDEWGNPGAGQELAVERMSKVVEANPNNVAVLTFWAMLHAEAPEATTVLRNEILPVVRKIVRKAPDFPPYQHLLGHFEWRCGNHSLAEAALERASALYAAHMKKHGQTFQDCDGWVRCQLYLATAKHSRGKFKESLEIATKLAALKVDPERLGAAGSNLVVWEARTLPARLYAARGWKDDFDLAIASLPGADDPQLFKDRSLSIFYLEGLRQYLGVRRNLELGKRDEAHVFRQHLSEQTLERFGGLQSTASLSSSISEYIRALNALEVYAAEARGLVALAGDATSKEVARSWFKIAAEKQQRPTLLMPPVVISPMELRLADYYSAMGMNNEAVMAYQDALQRRPNDLKALEGYETALRKIGKKVAADQTAQVIEKVQAN